MVLGGKRGTKRLKYLGDDSKFNMFSEDEGGTRDIQDVELEAPKLEKRRRSRSPDLGGSPKPPTQDQKSPGEKLKTTPLPPLRNFTDILMRRKRPEMDQDNKPRTPVRIKVKRLERNKEVWTPGSSRGGSLREVQEGKEGGARNPCLHLKEGLKTTSKD